MFIGRTDDKAETPILWLLHVKNWLIRKDPDAGRDWGQEEKGMAETEMAGWHHWLNGRESEWTPGVGDGQGGLACCDSWGHKESDINERLNWTELNWYGQLIYDKEIQPIHSKGDQSWVFFGRNDAKAETPVLWPLHAKSWVIGKDSEAGRDWEQEEKGTTEDEMAGWHHWLDGRESQWTLGVGDGQGGLVCCDSWGRKESDTTEQLICSDLILLCM